MGLLVGIHEREREAARRGRFVLARCCAGFGVFPELGVELEAVALGVGNEEAVTARIEGDRTGEGQPPFGFQAADLAAALDGLGADIHHHLGPLAQLLGVAAEGGDDLPSPP